MRSVDENKAALLELGSSPAMWRMLETMPHPSEEFGLWLIHDFSRLLQEKNPAAALEFKRQFRPWFQINALFSGPSRSRLWNCHCGG